MRNLKQYSIPNETTLRVADPGAPAPVQQAPQQQYHQPPQPIVVPVMMPQQHSQQPDPWAEIAAIRAQLAQQAAAAAPIVAAPPVPPPAAPEADPVLTELAALRAAVETERKAREAEGLEVYRLQQIAAARARGHELIEGLVFGADKGAVDAALALSIAETQMLRQQWGVGQPQQQQPAHMTAAPPPPAYPQFQPAAGPQPFSPAAPSAAAPAEQGLDLGYLTTHGVRTGEYAQVRNQLMQQLRSGTLRQGGWPQMQPQQQPMNFAPAAPPGYPMQQPQQLPGGAMMPQYPQQPQFYPNPPPIAGYPAPMGYPQQPGYPVGYPQAPQAYPAMAPQPAQVDMGAPINPALAVAAAHAAVAQRRAQGAQGMPEARRL